MHEDANPPSIQAELAALQQSRPEEFDITMRACFLQMFRDFGLESHLSKIESAARFAKLEELMRLLNEINAWYLQYAASVGFRTEGFVPERLNTIPDSAPNASELPSVEEMQTWLRRYFSERGSDFVRITAYPFARSLLYEGFEGRIATVYQAVQDDRKHEAVEGLEYLHKWYRDRMSFGGELHAPTLEDVPRLVIDAAIQSRRPS